MAGLGALVAAGLRGRRRGGLVATFLVLVLAAAAIAIGLSVINQGTRQIDAAAREADVAHLVLSGDATGLRQAAADPQLVATAGPFDVTDVVARLEGGDEETRLVALDDPAVAVGRPLLRSGRWLDPTRDDELVLDRSAAVELGLDPGDRVTVAVGDREVTFTVVGSAIDLTDCGYPQCDPIRAFVSEAGLARLGAPGYAILLARLPAPSLADATAARLLASVPGVRGSESWPDTRGDLLAVDRIFGRFVTVFGVFVLVAACIVVAGSLVVRMTARRREVGLLQAVGCTSRQVTLALVTEHLLVGMVAVVTGWLLAGLLAPQLQIGVSGVVGRSAPAWSPRTLVITSVLLGGVLVAATILPAWRVGRLPVSDVVRDVPPERLSWLARHTAGLPRSLGALGMQEAAARPGRSLLAALALALGVVTAIVASGFVGTIGEAVGSHARVGDPWDVTIDPAEGATPAAIEAVLATTPGVGAWFTETGRRTTLGDEAFLSQAIGGEVGAARYEIGEGRAVERPGEAVIGYGMVRRFGLGVGDTVTFTISTHSITDTVVGWYRETEDSGEVLQYRFEELERIEPGVTPEVVRVVAADGTEPAALAAALGGRLGRTAEVAAYEADVGGLGAFEAVLRLIALVVAAVAAANLLSVMLTSTRESARLIGVEQTLGFTPGQLIRHGAVAAASLGLLGALLGVPLGLWLFRVMSDAVTSLIGAGPGFGQPPSILALVVLGLAMVAVAGALGALAASRLARRPAAELVRWE